MDYEETQVYTLFVQAIDSNGGTEAMSSTVAVTVHVINVNEHAPVFTKPIYTRTVAEDEPVGAVLLTVFADDSDFGDDGHVVYSMATHAYFYMNSKTGELSLKSGFDYESTDKNFEFEVIATDSSTSPKSSSCTISVSLTDVNDNQPDCRPNIIAVTLPEDSLGGTVVAELSCSDADSNANGEIGYVIDSVNNLPSDGLFAVSLQGMITLESPLLNVEEIDFYSITVRVMDSGVLSMSTSATVKLAISDINEFSPEFDKLSYVANVLENTVSDVPIVSVHATDNDLNDHVQYHIEPTSPYFEIDSDSGNIFLVSALDFETLAPPKTVEITVYASDNGVVPGSKTSSATVTVSVTDANDGTPSFTQGMYYASLSEASTPETTVLRVEASDDDTDTLTYSLMNSSEIFRIEQSGDIVLYDTSNLDYDSDIKSYKLVALANDNRDGTGTATVYISVKNVNEHSPRFTDFDRALNIMENISVGEEVLIITATDADHGADGYISYAIVSGAYGKFSVDESSGKITVTDNIDREDISEYTLTISAMDSGTPQCTYTT